MVLTDQRGYMSGVEVETAIRSEESAGGTRTVQRVNGNDDASLGIVLGKEVERQLGLGSGDVVYLEIDEENGTGTIHFPERE